MPTCPPAQLSWRGGGCMVKRTPSVRVVTGFIIQSPSDLMPACSPAQLSWRGAWQADLQGRAQDLGAVRTNKEVRTRQVGKGMGKKASWVSRQAGLKKSAQELDAAP
eukprot:889712-Pelagomonas_calceolata.AAC.2